MSVNQPSWVLEKYITDHVLPHERIFSWIKWDSKVSVEKIILKCEADVIFAIFLNVSEEGLKDIETEKGKFTIEKKHLQIPGFIGFVAEYNAIPEKSRTINFQADLFSEEGVTKIELATEVLRPELYLEEAPQTVVISGDTLTQMPPINLKLRNDSKAFATNLELFSEITATQNVKVKVENVVTKIDDENLLFVESNKILTSKIFVSGQGYCMVSVGYDYQDRIGNKYKTNLIELGIRLEQKNSVEIPVTNDIYGNKEELILQSEKEPILKPLVVR